MIKYILLAFLFPTLIFAQIADKPEDASPLMDGEKIPKSILKTPEGEEVNAKKIFKDKKSIIIFYRGGWCPFCRAHLSDMGALQEEFIALGYQLIAISPDAPEKLMEKEGMDLSYQLYSDASTDFIQKMGLAFKAPLVYNTILKKNSNGENNEKAIPVPAIYIVDEKGVVQFHYTNPNYKERIDGGLVLTVAEYLAESEVEEEE